MLDLIFLVRHKLNHLIDLYANSAMLNHMVNNVHPSLDTLFAALADPSRRDILMMLLERDMTVQEIATPFNTSLAAISKHLQVLARAGIISQTKIGREKWCRLDSSALRPASVWIESYGHLLEDNYDVLETVIEQQAMLLQHLEGPAEDD